jgi:2-C-methyl-D-erythritol 2,4-cyclodiphosphate synthase
MNDETIDQAIYRILSTKLRTGTGLDFHSLYPGQPLILAGVPIPFDKGFKVKRSDGDPVSHALVDAFLAALGKGDIADWFSDQDAVIGARSVEYLRDLREKLLAPCRTTILNIQITILAEQPKLKPFFTSMRNEIALQLQIEPERINIQGKTFEGRGIIGQQQGIGAQANVLLLLDQP